MQRDGLSPEMRDRILRFQLNEITEYHIYTRLAQSVKSPENSAGIAVLVGMSGAIMRKWKVYTHPVRPNRLEGGLVHC